MIDTEERDRSCGISVETERVFWMETETGAKTEMWDSSEWRGKASSPTETRRDAILLVSVHHSLHKLTARIIRCYRGSEDTKVVISQGVETDDL